MEAFFFGSPETSCLIRWALLMACKNKKRVLRRWNGPGPTKGLASPRLLMTESFRERWWSRKGARVRVRAAHKEPPLWGSNVAVLITRWFSTLIIRQRVVRQYRVNMLGNRGSESSRGLTAGDHLHTNFGLFYRMLSKPLRFHVPYKFQKSTPYFNSKASAWQGSIFTMKLMYLSTLLCTCVNDSHISTKPTPSTSTCECNLIISSSSASILFSIGWHLQIRGLKMTSLWSDNCCQK